MILRPFALSLISIHEPSVPHCSFDPLLIFVGDFGAFEALGVFDDFASFRPFDASKKHDAIFDLVCWCDFNQEALCGTVGFFCFR